METLIDLEGYIYDKIDPRHRIYVGDEPLVQYAEELRLPDVEDDEE